MSELKPCPFCGATDGRLVQAFTRATDDFAFWSVECLDCGVEVADDSSQAAADAAWNRRAEVSRTPANAGEDGVREAGQRVLHDKVHAEARAIHLKDMTQSGYDFWVVRVAAEHGARIALSSIEEPRG